jgi:2'-5' RNA ligase
VSGPNWFVAFVVDAPWIVEALGSPPAGVRAFHPDDLHATLAFFGGVGEARARAGWAALEIALTPRAITLGAVVPLGASALSATLDDVEITRAMTSREAVWAAAGAARDDRAPLAHVTVARMARRASAEARAAALAWSAALRLETVPARIDRVALYVGRTDRRERLFDVVESRPL